MTKILGRETLELRKKPRAPGSCSDSFTYNDRHNDRLARERVTKFSNILKEITDNRKHSQQCQTITQTNGDIIICSLVSSSIAQIC